jgi:hypothetical protein
VRRLKEKADFKQRLDETLEAFRRQSGGSEYAGAPVRNPLEHLTRRHLIDHLLAGLGWNLSDMNEQMIEEARVKGEETLFLDYLGITPRTRVPLVIVEGKAWGKPIVGASRGGLARQGARMQSSYAGLVAIGLQHCKEGGGAEKSPVTAEWTEWLQALHDYVLGIYRETGQIVNRVAMCSGQWLVIFRDIEDIFIKAGEVPSQSILVFVDSELVSRSEEIFELLAPSGVVPQLVRPSRVPSYCSAADVSRLFRAIWVTRKDDLAHFQSRPQLIINAALVLERSDGVLLTILDDQLPPSRVPYDYMQLGAHIDEVAGLSEQLLQRTRTETGVALDPSAVNAFPGFRTAESAALPRVAGRLVDLLEPWRKRPNEYLLVLGTETHFLRRTPEVSSCGFHDWIICRTHGENQGASPILAPSVEPKAFFYSGQPHHCAHRTIHDRRANRCQIDAFDDFLCCRACTLQSFCWTEAEVRQLPCGRVPAQAEERSEEVENATAGPSQGAENS